eukprot:1196432-Prorocentrum_minimum.AAC.5
MSYSSLLALTMSRMHIARVGAGLVRTLRSHSQLREGGALHTLVTGALQVLREVPGKSRASSNGSCLAFFARQVWCQALFVLRCGPTLLGKFVGVVPFPIPGYWRNAPSPKHMSTVKLCLNNIARLRPCRTGYT